ncbi:MAG: YitT family protein [Clostridiales bacterium]|nr:YitT family protein [Clostridiales bacterium]
MLKKQGIRDYAIMTLGIVITAIGVYFLKFPNNFSTGGVTGISVIFAHLIPGISATGLANLLNLVLLVLGVVVIGRDFGVKTIYCTLLLTALLFLFERLIPLTQPLTDQPFMELMFSMVLFAVGAALLFNVGASSGGTDIIAMVLKKYTRIYSIGTALLLVDVAATVAAFFVFDIKTGLFSLFGLFTWGALLQGTLNALRQQRYFHIITTDAEMIRQFIISNIGRSATLFDGHGAFTGEERSLIMTVVNSKEAVELRSFIKEKSPNSFMLVTNTNDVVGKGFRSMM